MHRIDIPMEDCCPMFISDNRDLEKTPNQLKLFIDELASGIELQVEEMNSPLDELVPGGKIWGAELIETTPVYHIVSKQS